jgi:hypothetical protein
MEPGKVYRFNMQVKQTIKIDPGSLNPWTPESKNIEYDIVPLTVMPEVDEWGFRDVNIKWDYMIVPPEVDDWEGKDGGSFAWMRVNPIPEVDTWGDKDGFSFSWDTPDVASGVTQNPLP